MSSADNRLQTVWIQTGPTKRRPWSGSKLFDTLMVFQKLVFEIVDIEKISRGQKYMKNDLIALILMIANGLDRDLMVFLE